ncbi:transcription factor grauzone-like isoform 2-T2 [Cochliomyia hominivorax]
MLCCICLLETTNMLDIFNEQGKNLNIANIINKHFWFKTRPDDALTSHICTICWPKIEDFHSFYQTVEDAHKLYQENQHKKFVIKQEIAIIKEEEDLQEHDQTCEDNRMKTEFKDIEQQKVTDEALQNPLEYEHFLSDYNEDDDFDNEHITSSDGYELSENSESENIINKDKVDKKDNKRALKKKNKRKEENKINDKEDIPKRKKSSHHLDPILTEQLIKKHIPMLCDLCVFTGGTFSDIVAHFKEHHAEVQPYIMCCNRKFTRNYSIDQHAIIHENPDSFRCNECNRSFTTTYGLRTHNINHHSPEEKRIHACEFCPRRFGRRQLLEVHRQTHIPKEEWTITCTKCTTRTVKFVSQYLLNIHNSMFHRREAHICHVCAKEIKDKKAFEKHVRAHFEDSGPRVKCTYPNCGRWLKDEDNLKTHMQLHNLAGKTYKCSECNKDYPNRRALTNHKRYVHSNLTFRCEECDKTFKKAISLREHMTQHTGETLYSCPFCTRTFNSNANMHAHKKKQHPIEWKELRRKNIGPLPD